MYTSPLDELIVALNRPLRDFFIIQIGARASHLNSEDGFAVKIILTNLLPQTINPTALNLKVISVLTGQELVFKAQPNLELSPGKNEMQTTCNITAPGVYIFERVVLEWHSLVFQQEFVEMGKKQYLSLYPHGNALCVSAEIASESIPVFGVLWADDFSLFG